MIQKYYCILYIKESYIILCYVIYVITLYSIYHMLMNSIYIVCVCVCMKEEGRKEGKKHSFFSLDQSSIQPSSFS